MRFRVSSILLLTLGVAVVVYATRYGGQVTGLVFFLVGSTGGAISADRGIWQRCGRAAVGGAVALWAAMMLHAFVFAWEPTPKIPHAPQVQDAYQEFVKGQFLLVSAVTVGQGLIAGAVFGIMFHGIRSVVVRFRPLQREDVKR